MMKYSYFLNIFPVTIRLLVKQQKCRKQLFCLIFMHILDFLSEFSHFILHVRIVDQLM